MLSKIVDRITIGDKRDAQAWPHDERHFVVCTMPRAPIDEPPGAMWVSLSAAAHDKPSPSNLNAAAAVIHAAFTQGKNVLVHDETGDREASAAVAWFLAKHGEMTVKDAYEMIRYSRHSVRELI